MMPHLPYADAVHAALADAVALIADGRPPHRSTARWTNAPVLDRESQ